MTVTRIFDFPYYQLEKYNLKTALVTCYNGKWEETSTQTYIDKANAISRALLKLGVKKNEKIAVISSTNRTEWHLFDIGILQIGAQNVPIYPTISADDYQYILNHSEASYCFVSDIEIYKKLEKVISKTQLKRVYSFDKIPGCKHYTELLELGQDSNSQPEVEAIKESITPDDLATLIYTSGTTGKPKGVMLSHRNLVSNVLASLKRVPLQLGKSKALSFLPICHVFERMILYLYQYAGVSVYFAESIEAISDNLKTVKPHVMTGVPRLYEKVYDKIYAKGEGLSGVVKKLFYWAIDLGLEYQPYGQNGWWYEVKLSIARKLIFSKWKAGLGGNLELLVSGSAPLQERLAKVFAAANMPIMEGYGLTETSPVISVNDERNKGFRTGTVGRIIDNVEVKIAEDGEILIKGPNVMIGYFKDDEKTKSVIKNGYFHTGDKGEIDSDGFLKITGRKKEMFKTSGGKYIIPTLLENKLKQSRFIEQVMVIGEGEKMAAALIQPNFEFVNAWAKRQNITLNSNEELILNPKVIERILQEVTFHNAKFGKWETIKKFELTADEWSVDAGHLTPTMKMKREIIKGIYSDLYTKIYDC